MAEQIYTVPLRQVKKVPLWRRSNRAISELKGYLSRHMKVPEDLIKLGTALNEVIWAKSGGKPPLKVRVKAVKMEDGIVNAEYAGDR